MEWCIYCGNNELNTDIGECWKCNLCGLTIERSDYQDIISNLITAQNHLQDQNSAEAVYADEAETLASAWQLMQSHAWDKALDTLLPAAIPSLHPLEFAVWRNICRIAPALSDNDLQSRSPLLELLQRNLHCLGYFLSTAPEAQKHQTIKNIYQALKLLRSLVLGYLNDSDSNVSRLHKATPTTNRLCASILMVLAQALESQGSNAEFGTDYLKMSAQLYHWSLELYLAPNFKNIDKYSLEVQEFKLYASKRKRITAKLEQLHAIISTRDEQAVLQDKVPEPNYAPTWANIIVATGWLAALFLIPLSWYLKDLLEAYCQEQGFQIPSITDEDMTTIIMIVLISLWVAFTIYTDIRYNSFLYSRYYNRLAQELKTPSQDSESANYSLS
ncbi:MAG: hypothetical protein Q4F00_09135 [bacterium]|nr:hypothetical protein [bacterium]